ncbi:hypothetical protein D1AOALGA4SA_9720 [Olavius algarvensis Delta 1 endosymbiont]|nr:hypothetical protein D1AOALGA4SA_9720 [Olavius algarvensis Delta 1 endosymbiont]
MVSLRSVYHISIDHLTAILFKKLTPKFIFANACIPWVYREAEKYFALFAQNIICNYLTHDEFNFLRIHHN